MRILTVCVGNVCRSPLAERLLAVRFAEAWARGFDTVAARPAQPTDGAARPAQPTVSSAGVMGLAGRPMEPQAAEELRRLGGDPDGFAARRLTESMVAEADLVLTATLDVRRRVLEEAPGGLRRTFTLRELALLLADDDLVAAASDVRGLLAAAAKVRARVAGEDLDVVDPMGRDAAVHAEAADLVSDAVDTIVAAVTRVVDVRR